MDAKWFAEDPEDAAGVMGIGACENFGEVALTIPIAIGRRGCSGAR